MQEASRYNHTDELKERAIIVGVISQNQTEEEVAEYLDELAFLAETAGADTVKRFVQKLEHPDPKTFVGSGKLNEILKFRDENNIDMLIFDDELSPSQIRNIERVMECKILDRSSLILDIFAKRAQTASAKTQVELAQLQYLLPRLTRMWTHLERQKGGIGMRGPGETQIETDRRIVKDKIALLKTRLEKIDKQTSTQRQNRGKMVRASLVGYTNVGKSTIMNMIGKTDIFAENKLFATLDTTVRKIVIDNIPFLLSDTVGFIRKLPHQLVNSFKSTLDEVRESDILIHVLDISHPCFEDHYNTVNDTLKEIGVENKPTILVFNKIDAFTFTPKDEDDLTPRTRDNDSLEDLKKTWMSRMNEDNCVFISAQNKTNVEELKEKLYKAIKEIHIERFPYNDFLYNTYE